MSEDYLASDKKQSALLQALAGGIIRNQTFEIGMLDNVESNIKDIDLSNGPGWYKVADQGLAVNQRFIRAPAPPIQDTFHGDDVASAEDVKFAKAMIVHHEGALMMAHDYLDNPNTQNGYLERLNLDVLRDQAQEIQLMWNIVASYPGDHCAIQITPDMIDGMDDMMGHMDFSKVNCTAKSECCCRNMGGHGHHMKKMCDKCGSMKGGQCPSGLGGGQSKKRDMHSGHHAH